MVVVVAQRLLEAVVCLVSPRFYKEVANSILACHMPAMVSNAFIMIYYEPQLWRAKMSGDTPMAESQSLRPPDSDDTKAARAVPTCAA